jgi:AraC-like DNA-binding protein
VLRYREIRPSARLQPLVQTFWTLEHTGELPGPQRVIPDGHSELILNLGKPFQVFREGGWQHQEQFFLAGQLEEPLLLRPDGPARILGIRFHPHSAAQVFDVPAHQLTGRFAKLHDLSPVLANACGEALESGDPQIQRIDSALVALAQSSPMQDVRIEEAVRRITADRGSTNLSSLARELGLSLRHFERRFRNLVGLTPKLFSRMQRFVHVFGAISEPGGNWVDTALDCGYYDQSHLIRDCRDLSGSTPAALLAPEADLARRFLERFGMSHSSKTAGRPDA